MKQMPFNPYKDGTCRTIKYNYHKTSAANYIRQDGLGATAVLEVFDMEQNTDKVMQMCQYDSSQNNRIVSVDGISPCVANGSKDGMPKIAEPQVLVQKRSEQGKAERRKHKNDVGVKWQTGNKQWELREDGVANTLTTNTKDNMLAEPTIRVDGNVLIDKQGRTYRIRRLTERECFRLMDVSDADIDKIQVAGISRSQQYRMAGNSIVVSCMYHLFRKLLVEKGNEEVQQYLF